MNEKVLQSLWAGIVLEPQSAEARTALRAALDLMAMLNTDNRSAHWRRLALTQGWIIEHGRNPKVVRAAGSGERRFLWEEHEQSHLASHFVSPQVFQHIKPPDKRASGFPTLVEAEEALSNALHECGEID